MHPARVRITVDIGTDEATFEINPPYQAISDNPAQVASGLLDSAVADARTWLQARGAVNLGDKRRLEPNPDVALAAAGDKEASE